MKILKSLLIYKLIVAKKSNSWKLRLSSINVVKIFKALPFWIPPFPFFFFFSFFFFRKKKILLWDIWVETLFWNYRIYSVININFINFVSFLIISLFIWMPVMNSQIFILVMRNARTIIFEYYIWMRNGQEWKFFFFLFPRFGS